MQIALVPCGQANLGIRFLEGGILVLYTSKKLSRAVTRDASSKATPLHRSRQSTNNIKLAALIEWRVWAQIVAEENLARPRDLLFGIEEHFFPLRDPPAGARNRKQHREHGDRETHRLVDQPGIKIHVGIELAGDEIIVLEGDT